MPFPFVYVCDLLEQLAQLITHHPPLLPKVLDNSTAEAALKWLREYRHLLDAATTDDDAVMRMFQPEKRSERILDADSLEQAIARVLNLPKKQLQDLRRWRHEPIAGDLAACVERVLESMADAKQRLIIRAEAIAVSVERIDESLLLVASRHKSSTSCAETPTLGGSCCDTIQVLGNIFKPLPPREAKWLTRLILKDFGPVKFPKNLMCKSNISFLPHCVHVSAQLSSSIPSEHRRDGPGLLRLTAAASAHGLPSTPSLTAPVGPARSNGYSDGPRSCHLRLPYTENSSSGSMTRNGDNHGSPVSRLQGTGPRSIGYISIGGNGKCQLTDGICPFANCLFILSPCVAKVPWLTENLLSWHGSRFTTSPGVFSKSPTLSSRCPQTGKKYRRIALVEPNRLDQTVEFLKSIRRLNLKRSRGQKQWVEVYNWRILECIAKADRRQSLDYNPWRRCWMGAI